MPAGPDRPRSPHQASCLVEVALSTDLHRVVRSGQGVAALQPYIQYLSVQYLPVHYLSPWMHAWARAEIVCTVTHIRRLGGQPPHPSLSPSLCRVHLRGSSLRAVSMQARALCDLPPMPAWYAALSYKMQRRAQIVSCSCWKVPANHMAMQDKACSWSHGTSLPLGMRRGRGLLFTASLSLKHPAPREPLGWF